MSGSTSLKAWQRALLFAMPLGLLALLFIALLQDRPKASSLRLVTEEEVSVKVPLELKKSGVEAEFRIHDQPKRGKLIGPIKELRYQPEKDFVGTDHFEYVAIVKGVQSKPAWVEIEVTPVNDAPLAEPQSLFVEREQEAKLTLSGSDPDQDFLVYRILEEPRHGELVGEPPHLTYRPKAGFMGEDSFTFRTEDALSASESARVLLKVVPPNEPPRVEDIHLFVERDKPSEVRLRATDPEGDELKYELLSQPKNGSLHLEGGRYYYTPRPDFTGEDGFEFRARDHRGASEPARVILSVHRPGLDEKTQSRLKQHVTQGGLVVGHYSHPDLIYQKGNYVPASILKIATASAALYYLGKDYRFHSQFFLDRHRNLYIKGFGDPGMDSDQWHQIAEELSKRGIFDQPIRQLILDDSAFDMTHKVLGRERSLKAYDAAPGALATNRNEAHFRIHSSGEIQSLDERTPVTDWVRKKARGLRAGEYHISVAQSAAESSYHSMELIEAIFGRHGMRLRMEPKRSKRPLGAKLILEWQSQTPLEEHLRFMLKESNNFIANQLVWAMALKRYGAPANLDDGVFLLYSFLEREVKIPSYELRLQEGSGLSRGNRVSLLAMLKLMEYFSPHKELLSDVRESPYPDLARAGSKGRILAKTGTLRSISNLAGYILTKEKTWKPFVLMMQEDHADRGKVLEALVDAYN